MNLKSGVDKKLRDKVYIWDKLLKRSRQTRKGDWYQTEWSFIYLSMETKCKSKVNKSNFMVVYLQKIT